MNNNQINIIPITLAIIASLSIVLIYIVHQLEMDVDERFRTEEQEVNGVKQFGVEVEQEFNRINRILKNFVDIAYSTLEFNYNSITKQNIEYKKEINKLRLKSIIEVTETILALNLTEHLKDEKLTKSEEQALTIEVIQQLAKQIKYDDGMGYVWFIVNTRSVPKMLHPFESSLDESGKDLKDSCTADTSLFTEFTEAVKKNKAAFVERKCKSSKNILIHEFSYVKLLPKWDWIIGTSISLDNVVDANSANKKGSKPTKDIVLANKIEGMIRSMQYDDGAGFFWITNNKESTPKFFVYPLSPSAENRKLSGKYSKYASLIQSFTDAIDKSNDKNSSYLNYNWDKPTSQGTIKDVLKYSYVKLHKASGLIIGTGVYMDDVHKSISKTKKSALKRISSLRTRVLVLTILLILSIVLLNLILNDLHYSKH